MSSSGPPVQFKFTHFSTGCTRRISFPVNPSWQLLASNLEALYAIPVVNVAVSYLDDDNDEVTLSTERELSEFYNTSHRPGQLIKFRVLDLSSPHPPQLSGIPSFPSASSRAFVVQEDVDEWQIPMFSTVPSSESGPHAFVEVLGSNASTLSMEDAPHNDEDEDEADDNVTVKSVPEHDQTSVRVDKGKQKAVTLSEFPSTASLIAEDISQKHPIHVYAVSANEDANNEEKPVPGAFVGEAGPADAESTPKSRVRSVDDAPNPDSQAAPDPPLPNVEETASSASLSNDLATFLTSLNNAVASHPELSEGLRNILRNVANGTYWQSHRDSLSRAASDITDSLGDMGREARRQAEDEAGRRVTRALSGIFRTLSTPISDVIDVGPNNNVHTTEESRTSPAFHDPYRNRHVNQGHHSSWGRNWYNQPPSFFPPPFLNSTSSSGPSAPPPASGPPPPPGPPPSLGPPPPRGPHYGSRPAPPPPPPGPPPPIRPHYASRPPPPPPGQPLPLGPPYVTGLPTPPPPVSGLPPPPHFLPLQAHFRPHKHVPFIPPESSPLSQTYNGTVVPHNPDKPGDSSQSKTDAEPRLKSPEELRAEVEAAKKVYKASKEQYRQEREVRRRQQQGIGGSDAIQQREPGSTSIDNARLPISTTGVFSIRRHNTHPGHGSGSHRHGGDKKPEDLVSRAIARMTKRLSDMGFTESGFPEVSSMIKARLPDTRSIAKEDEDTIVTMVLEELLAFAPKP